ncbi:N-acetylmuramoyl-L-alanine amidase family protein [Chondromyces apiculatus]|uniref:N-acetylmuramoyl-L-alanine amidase n=1 Tax=Chondromyces apiculatus DSM 436 TaxID=1192034 RepID=A0A017TBE8_9BACT|nr:N-acetylmuramoyl-L-alanine amidase [Chondromyces apiculatus]EYF06145.1 Hypothetical protein CAP_2335 [Chondromyces apiculatus DSM 436]
MAKAATGTKTNAQVPASPSSGQGSNTPVSATQQGCQEKRVIVIDPGHGGTANADRSTWNNATSVSGVMEKDLTLQYAQSLKRQLASAAVKQIFTSKNYCDVQVILTRETDVNLAAADRVAVAKTNKADIFFSIHFNGAAAASARGTETFYRSSSNGHQTNEAEDRALARSVNAAAVAAIGAVSAGSKDRGAKADSATGHGSLYVLRDPGIGLSGDMCRSVLIEVEFITNTAVDQALVKGPQATANRDAVMLAVAKALANAL